MPAAAAGVRRLTSVLHVSRSAHQACRCRCPCPAAVAGAAFFWTFEVLVFLVLLNFLLAIIVDAFGQVGGLLQRCCRQACSARGAHHL